MEITFGAFRLDLAARQLFRDGAEIHLSPKAFELLRVLVESRPRALSKAELQEHLWPATFVTESNLPMLVAELRRVLDDRPKNPRFLRTVHGFGYAFCGPTMTDAVRPAAGAPSYWVICEGREIALNPGANVVGRDADAAVRLDRPTVSRRHARIVVAPDGVWLEDLGSKNGTRLRGSRIDGRARMADADEVQVGSVRFTVRMPGASGSTQTASGQ